MRSELPTGVVTLLFTDIEGSTRLLTQLGADYGDVLAHHRKILRRACDDHRGVVVDSQGDAMFLAFVGPADATAAARQAQSALADGPVRVRMGIHSGTPEQHDGGYVGLDVHRGARIAAAGHGGQVLLSATTRALVPMEAVEDLGTHQLKDLESPEHLFQLHTNGAPVAFPPLRTTESERPRLPEFATSFVGREGELQRMAELLSDRSRRLVSIVGPGGAGKTRLSLEAARREWERSRRPVAFAPLVAVETGDQLVTALADAVGYAVDLAHAPGGPEEQLIDYLRRRDMVIVADNFEQLLPAAGILARIIEAAPKVTVIVTSRSRLELDAEWVVDLGGLTDGEDGDTAVRLFVERARQRDPDFAVGDEDWPAVRRICRSTEAMPLALELAAAWSPVLTTEQLADELERDLDILATSAGDRPERHRSLRAAFTGSWRLLDEVQQQGLAGLGVFHGPCRREAARAVADVALPTLAELVSRSLLRKAGDRFETHDLIRGYAREQAQASGTLEATAERHARYFVDLVASRYAELTGAASPAARAELHPDLPDVRAAMIRAVRLWQPPEVVPALRSLMALWSLQVDPAGPLTLRELARVAAEERDPATDASGTSMSRTLAGYVALSLASVDAHEDSDHVVDEHLSGIRASGERMDLALCLLARGMNRCNRDENAESIEPLAEADRLFAELGEDLPRADTLTWLGWAHMMLDDIDAAQLAFETAHRLAVGAGDPATVAFTNSKLGLLDDVRQRPAEALERHLEAFTAFDAAGNPGGVGFSLSRASVSAYMLGRHASAVEFGHAAYEAFTELGHRWGRTGASARVAFAYLGLEKPERAQEWGLRGLGIGRDGVRVGQLYALSAVAAARVHLGAREPWLEVLRATVTDPEVPALISLQARHELARLEIGPAGAAERTEVDLDATIDRLSDEARTLEVS